MSAPDNPFPEPGSTADIEEGAEFAPRFNADGLIPAVACDAEIGTVLMLAYMNPLALQKTIETGVAHYWSRSRGKLWKKGETSGEVQHVHAILTDCDQDTVVLQVKVQGRGATCHTGRVSCFYRRLEHTGSAPGRLTMVDGERLFDPAEVYRKT